MGDQLSVLEEYIKQGLEKGFNINYIKDVLTQHGHPHDRVHTAANNVMGLQYPDSLKPHLDEVRKSSGGSPWMILALSGIVVVLLIATVWLIVANTNQRQVVAEAQSDLEDIQSLGYDIDDVSDAIKEQNELLRQKDLSISEKERIINDQIARIEDANSKIDAQRKALNTILIDLLNRMIGRINNPSE